MTSELTSLLSLNIPESVPSPDGFLEIIRKSHHENINSSIYAYFINSKEPFVSELFMSSLLELVEEKSTLKFSFGEAFAECEVKTANGRLDILISDKLGNEYLIIENKIYHWLHNDLMDYWDHVKAIDDKKVGILLTLEKHSIPENVQGKFINITHGEWINKIKSKGIPFGLSPRVNTYITDFVNTIDHLTKSYEMDEQSKFYFQHANRILKVQETIVAAHSFLNDQFQLIANKLGLQNYGNALDWRNFWDADNNIDIYMTIVTAPLLNGELRYKLILELNRKDKERYQDIENFLRDEPQFKLMQPGESRWSYMHFGVRNYEITMLELEQFSEIVVKNIREDFADTLIKTVKKFYPNCDISSWEKNLISTPDRAPI
ncbi:PD-(D/E)XK nuclease family protein [Fluviicola taffensis]|uniref:PD-(D/E)XK nuclease family protein n=1 Tax=Fluviicola taffensis TaxID=191579 RepID=UPI0031382335